jgi:hypothetical protein
MHNRESAAILLTIACLSCSRTDANGSTCTPSCRDDAIVRVLSGQSATSAKAVCFGAVVARKSSESIVLTAGHCIDAVSSTFVQAKGATYRVTRAHVHPRFERREVSSAYDFALLIVSESIPASTLPIARKTQDRLLDREVRVFVQSSRWEGAMTRKVRPLAFELTSVPWADCQGHSGAPVLLEAAGGFVIAGVVSHGKRQCQDVTVGRISAARDGFIDAVLKGARPTSVSQSCAECQDEIHRSGEACVTATTSCDDETTCSQWRDNLLSSGRVSSRASARAEALARCLCSSRCRMSCEALCSTEH